MAYVTASGVGDGGRGGWLQTERGVLYEPPLGALQQEGGTASRGGRIVEERKAAFRSGCCQNKVIYAQLASIKSQSHLNKKETSILIGKLAIYLQLQNPLRHN